MAEDVRSLVDSKANSPLSTLPRKLAYVLALSGAYAFLCVLAYGNDTFLVFFLACLGFSFLPLFGILPSLWRTFLMLAAALLVMSLVPAGFLQGDYRTFPPNMDLTLDISSENVPGVEGPQRVTTDEMGYRTGDRVIQYDDANPYRIFAIGASTTEQGFLDDSRTWTRRLEDLLSPVASTPMEVINTGVAGLRLVNHLATQERIEALNPDLVLFLIGVNDWNRQVTNHFDRQLRFRKSLLSRLRNQFQQSIAFTFYRIYILLPQRTQLVVRDHRFTSMTDRESRPDVVRYMPEAVSDDYADGLGQLAERCRRGGYRCMILTQPTSYYVDAPSSVTKYFRLTPPGRSYTLDLESLVHMESLYNGFAKDFAAKEGLLLCDLAAMVPKGTEAFYDDVHFNTNGARIVAEALSACIVDQVSDF